MGVGASVPTSLVGGLLTVDCEFFATTECHASDKFDTLRNEHFFKVITIKKCACADCCKSFWQDNLYYFTVTCKGIYINFANFLGQDKDFIFAKVCT